QSRTALSRWRASISMVAGSRAALGILDLRSAPPGPPGSARNSSALARDETCCRARNWRAGLSILARRRSPIDGSILITSVGLGLLAFAVAGWYRRCQKTRTGARLVL